MPLLAELGTGDKMSMLQHIIDEIHEITQEEINTIHLEIHKITNRDLEGIESEEMSKKGKRRL